MCHFAVAVIVTVTGIGPRLNVMTPPSAAARAAVAGAQFAGVPVPMTWRTVAQGEGRTRRPVASGHTQPPSAAFATPPVTELANTNSLEACAARDEALRTAEMADAGWAATEP